MVDIYHVVATGARQPELDVADRFDYVFKKYQKMTGGEYLGFNNGIFLSERQAADRNFALAYFMRENKCFSKKHMDLVSTLDFYFQVEYDFTIPDSSPVPSQKGSLYASLHKESNICEMPNPTIAAMCRCVDILVAVLTDLHRSLADMR